MILFLKWLYTMSTNGKAVVTTKWSGTIRSHEFDTSGGTTQISLANSANVPTADTSSYPHATTMTEVAALNGQTFKIDLIMHETNNTTGVSTYCSDGSDTEKIDMSQDSDEVQRIFLAIYRELSHGSILSEKVSGDTTAHTKINRIVVTVDLAT